MNQNIPDFRHFAQANMNVNPFNNMNFNKCMYTPQANPSQLYQAYDGFIRGNMFPDLYNQYKINKEEMKCLKSSMKSLNISV